MAQNKMALKPYIEAIGNHCNQLSRDELMATIIQLAKEVPVGERGIFLSKLHTYSTGNKTIPDEETGCSRIDALKEEIQERIDALIILGYD